MEDKYISDVISSMDIKMHNNYNGIMLTDDEYNVLKKYGFDPNNYGSVSSLIFDIESTLNEEADIEDLERVLDSLSEFNYYHNTNK